MFNSLINAFASSSVDPSKPSLSLKGLLLANVGIIVFVLQYLDVPFTEAEVTNIIGLVSVLVGAAITAVGAARKVWVAVAPKFR